MGCFFRYLTIKFSKYKNIGKGRVSINIVDIKLLLSKFNNIVAIKDLKIKTMITEIIHILNKCFIILSILLIICLTKPTNLAHLLPFVWPA
jgi:hypothetical protein